MERVARDKDNKFYPGTTQTDDTVHGSVHNNNDCVDDPRTCGIES